MTTPLECDFTEYMIKSIPLDDGLTFPENDDLYKKTLGFLYQQNPDATFSETTSLSDSKYFISGIQQSDSVMNIHIYYFSDFFPL